MTVQGLSSLKRKLLVTLPDAARAEIAKAMEAGAQEMVNLARSLVPVDKGDLRETIGWTWGDAPKGSITIGTVRAKGRGAGNMVITIFAGSDEVFWARWQEFGTKHHRASPFFYPSYRALKKRMRGRTSRAINKAAKRAAAGGSGGTGP